MEALLLLAAVAALAQAPTVDPELAADMAEALAAIHATVPKPGEPPRDIAAEDGPARVHLCSELSVARVGLLAYERSNRAFARLELQDQGTSVALLSLKSLAPDARIIVQQILKGSQVKSAAHEKLAAQQADWARDMAIAIKDNCTF